MSNRHKNLKNQNNEDFFIRLLNAWVNFINKKFPIPTPIEGIIDQLIFLNPYTRLYFSSYNPYS